MAYLQLDDTTLPLRPGETAVSAGPSGVRLDADGARVATIVVQPSGVTIRRAGDAGAVRVNGVALGIEPTPLIHGDRIECDGAVLIFGDEAKGGSTQYFSGATLAAAVKARAGHGGPAGTSGGRLVSLTDGREYVVEATPFAIGRDPSCEVVVASGEVSRRHAEIELGADGYYVIDLSTNGLLVNGTRVDGTASLARGDVLRIGPEEFRFYAERRAEAAAAPAPVAAEAPPAAPVRPATPSPARPTPAAPTSTPRSGGIPAWVWAAAVLAAAAAYFFLQGRS
jgi:hypothetical protein